MNWQKEVRGYKRGNGVNYCDTYLNQRKISERIACLRNKNTSADKINLADSERGDILNTIDGNDEEKRIEDTRNKSWELEERKSH